MGKVATDKAFNNHQRAGPESERALLLSGSLLFGFTLPISLYINIKRTPLDWIHLVKVTFKKENDRV